MENSEFIRLNVGGKLFYTSKTTLTVSEPDSMLARMFSDRLTPCCKDEEGNYLIDRSPQYFEPILNFLRTGKLIIDPGVNPLGVLEEARYYGMESIIPHLDEMLEDKRKENVEDPPMSRREIVRILAATESHRELRFQGLNLTGADMSKLDLRNINFKYAKMKGCSLKGANLTSCNLERADISSSCLDGAQLAGVRMLCTNLESASLKKCNFECPAGILNASLEGCNLKNADLDGNKFYSPMMALS